MTAARANPSKTRTRSVLELIVTIVAAVALALLIQAFVVKPYRIPSSSMVPTLAIGQRVLTNRLDDHPSIGDIVVFHPPRGADSQMPLCGDSNEGDGHDQPCGVPTAQASSQTFIKRIVAGPGDKIAIVDGHALRNGVREKDPYIKACADAPSCTFRKPIVVPPGDYFMMGDNRGASDDSRFWGPVPASSIIGVAFFTYWPPDRIGSL